MRSVLEDEFALEIPRVYRFALRLADNDAHLAEDITQETFVRAWKHRRRVHRERSIRTLLFRIAHNLWRDHLRKIHRRGESSEITSSECVAPPAGLQVEGLDEAKRILLAMAALPPRQREVLHLVVCEEISHADVARILGISTDAVKASLSLARRNLRTMCDQRESRERGESS